MYFLNIIISENLFMVNIQGLRAYINNNWRDETAWHGEGQYTVTHKQRQMTLRWEKQKYLI